MTGAILKCAEQDLYANSLTQSALLFKYLDSNWAESLHFWNIGLLRSVLELRSLNPGPPYSILRNPDSVLTSHPLPCPIPPRLLCTPLPIPRPPFALT